MHAKRLKVKYKLAKAPHILAGKDRGPRQARTCCSLALLWKQRERQSDKDRETETEIEIEIKRGIRQGHNAAVLIRKNRCQNQHPQTPRSRPPGACCHFLRIRVLPSLLISSYCCHCLFLDLCSIPLALNMDPQAGIFVHS